MKQYKKIKVFTSKKFKMISKLLFIVLGLSTFSIFVMTAPPPKTGAVMDMIEGDTRLLGGQFCSRSYQVALMLGMKNGKKSFCGGSLIAPGWVLTAAHCTEVAKNITMNFGSQLRAVPHKIANSTEFMMHPKWDSQELKFDCALVRYKEEDVTIDGVNITTVRLPSSAQKNETFDWQNVTVSGWGRESDFAIKPGDKLRCLSGTVLPNQYCSAPYFGVIGPEHICMQGRPQSSTCHGDSGGPLMYTGEKDGLPTQVGIVSFGPAFGCGWSWPPVFARVTACQDWINEMTNPEQPPKEPIKPSPENPTPTKPEEPTPIKPSP